MPTQAPPLKIAFVITELEVGGAEQCLVRLACGLPSSQFTCRVYSLAGPPQGNRSLVERLQSQGIPIHFLGGRGPGSIFSVLRQLRRAWRAHRPDLVQSFLFHANVLAGLSCPARTPLAMGIRVADPRPWRIRLERWIAGTSRPAICVSQEVARHLGRHGFPSRQLPVIPNGIELQAYRDVKPADLAAEGIAEQRRVWLMAGRLDHQKGLDWLCELAPTLLTKHPDVDLIVAGDGPQRDWLGRRILELGLAPRIHLLGWRPDVPSLLARCELLLLTSRYEGMPNVVLEAMASGKPVVATRVEGIAELLGEGLEGQGVDFRDTAGFLRRLDALSDSPALRKQFGESNLRRASEVFSLSVMVARYAELYQQLARDVAGK